MCFQFSFFLPQGILKIIPFVCEVFNRLKSIFRYKLADEIKVKLPGSFHKYGFPYPEMKNLTRALICVSKKPECLKAFSDTRFWLLRLFVISFNHNNETMCLDFGLAVSALFAD